MGKYGTNYDGFGAFEGGVNADKGAPLLSTNSDGATSLLMGAPLIREIQAGVANGDFAITPDDASSTITSTNPLPYWSFTDVSSAGAITCAIVADSSNASGNVLRWSVAGATTTGKSATLTRYISVPGSRNREFVFVPEMTLLAATASTVINSTIGFTWYKSDGVTTTGTGNTSSTANTFTVIGAGPTTITAGISPAVNLAAPSDAAFMLITITVATTGTVSAGAKTLDLAEVRVASGQSDVYVAENTTPGTYGPSRFRQANGTLTLQPNLGGSGSFAVSGSQTVSSTLDVTGALSAIVSANNKTVITGSSTISTGSAVGDNVLTTFVTSDTNNRFKLEQNGKISWGSGSGAVDVSLTRSTDNELTVDGDFVVTYLVTTDPNSAIVASGGGNISLTGPDTSVPISGNGELKAIPNTTTLTTNSARWVLIAGNTYGLRRDSSTRRVKTNIVEADNAVLTAAKNLRAVHYEALEKDAEGNVVPSGKHTLGFIAEEIADAGLDCAVTYDGEGLPDGYDERVLIAALLVRINDLEERLAALES